ncbi:MAG TPA: nucleotidyl transferase AbiEii/AbiGii toxin family protein [Candidatus Nanoarchaeia archaeon]|nr:nucleotidyl transferase AbiEii/AbiGii toxin family protein [Candidatus Nanoarchaeia archaeon]
MVKIALGQKLKKHIHQEIALAQDILVEELYITFPTAILHGGTAIWRCYGGGRFSEDLDVYLPRDEQKIASYWEKLKERGFILEKKKVTANSIYSTLQLQRQKVRFEALFLKKDNCLKEYETISGNYLTVLTLTPEQFVEEKVNAYLNRKKIRDLYDIFFLLRFVQDRKGVLSFLKRLLDDFPAPADEEELQVLILEGVVPSVQKMKEYIERYCREG